MTEKLCQAQSWIFDLDNTLYPASCNLFSQIDVKMGEFICAFLDVGQTEAKAIQKDYFHNHGTTLNGLMHNHDLAPEIFLDFVHDIDYGPVPLDNRLDAALRQLTGDKYILTNGTVRHAEKVLERLGITTHFEGIFDIVAADFIPKPRAEPYEKFVRTYGIDPTRSVMVEDMAKNLAHPARMGMQTVWVETDSDWARAGSDGEYIHHATDDLPAWLHTLPV